MHGSTPDVSTNQWERFCLSEHNFHWLKGFIVMHRSYIIDTTGSWKEEVEGEGGGGAINAPENKGRGHRKKHCLPLPRRHVHCPPGWSIIEAFPLHVCGCHDNVTFWTGERRVWSGSNGGGFRSLPSSFPVTDFNLLQLPFIFDSFLSSLSLSILSSSLPPSSPLMHFLLFNLSSVSNKSHCGKNHCKY